MKLFEISARVDIDALIDVARALDVTTSNGWTDAGQAYKVLRQYYSHPAMQPFMYTGKMYRVLISEGEDGLEREDILAHGGTKLYSFARTEDALETFYEQLGDIEETQTMTYVSQTGKGYDVQKIYRYIIQYGEADIQQAAGSTSDRASIVYHLKRAGKVMEIVAPLNASLQVYDTHTVNVDNDYYDDDDD